MLTYFTNNNGQRETSQDAGINIFKEIQMRD